MPQAERNKHFDGPPFLDRRSKDCFIHHQTPEPDFSKKAHAQREAMGAGRSFRFPPKLVKPLPPDVKQELRARKTEKRAATAARLADTFKLSDLPGDARLHRRIARKATASLKHLEVAKYTYRNKDKPAVIAALEKGKKS